MTDRLSLVIRLVDELSPKFKVTINTFLILLNIYRRFPGICNNTITIFNF